MFSSTKSTRPQQWGTTPPISTLEPTQLDLDISESLTSVLISFNLYEADDEALRREQVLGNLNEMIQEFVRQQSIKQGLTEQVTNEIDRKGITAMLKMSCVMFMHA